MKYADYRAKLGIGFNDEEKLQKLKNQIRNFIFAVSRCVRSSSDVSYGSYFIAIMEPIPLGPIEARDVIEVICNGRNLNDVLCRFVSFCNSAESIFPEYVVKKIKFRKMPGLFLDNLHIAYEEIKDRDGIFLLPKGAEELDSALVSEPFEWMKSYPDARKAFTKALIAYGESSDATASEIADQFRKALECFFQIFFKNQKSLENMVEDYGQYLGSKGMPSEMCTSFKGLLKAYTALNNNHAKHRDSTPAKALEYVMYETGNIIRLLISLEEGK